MRRANLVLLSLLGIGAALGVVSNAAACSCRRGSAEDAVAAARNIALVTIQSVRVAEVAGDKSGESDRRGPQRGRFTLVRQLKGELAQDEEISAGYGFGDCGAPLVVGTSYVVFDDGGPPQLALCRGFFGPYLLYGDERSDAKITRFVDALVAHVKTGAPIARPPSPLWGIDDSSAVWFGPPQD
ncbi:hypothetical protein DFR29_11899 [Tahibacter aquaticus]|uniref:Uncharacterized protein n=1 Tax=Tahibacter aquaticus TaxID=520092 RepID=A0A4R6YN14_9GAMM|nr:hypothetical protein [Tahibacter aquaticus]TDR38956.1 hypothetical protein DFR29_11899 [Tahibacter aquaticus]